MSELNESNNPRVTATSLTLENARKMTMAYRDNRKKHEPNDNYTKSVWFPLKQIEIMTQLLKEEGADGLRIYFGRYTKDVRISLNAETNKKPIKEIDDDKDTLIFVSTKEGSDKDKHNDYFVYETQRQNTIDKIKDNFGLFIEPENRGDLCPHNCPEEPSPLMQD